MLPKNDRNKSSFVVAVKNGKHNSKMALLRYQLAQSNRPAQFGQKPTHFEPSPEDVVNQESNLRPTCKLRYWPIVMMKNENSIVNIDY